MSNVLFFFMHTLLPDWLAECLSIPNWLANFPEYVMKLYEKGFYRLPLHDAYKYTYIWMEIELWMCKA